MFNWFKKLREIVRNYDSNKEYYDTSIAMTIRDVSENTYDITELRRIIKERTDIHADIHFKSPHQIILAGRYRGRDYVQMYSIDENYFEHLIETLRKEKKYAVIKRIDAPLNFKAVMEHEFGE